MTFIEAVLYLCGAASVEDLQEDLLEHYSSLAENPVSVNISSRSELAATGLFSNYQVVTLCDYLKTAGEVLSVAELAVIDGFNEELAKALSFFIRFDSHSPVGTPSTGRERNCSSQMLLRSSLKPGKFTNGFRYDADIGNMASLWCGISASKQMESLTAGAAYMDSRGRFSAVLGDFNARFAQGLALWNTLSLSSFKSVSSMIKRPTGLGPSSSFASNYALTGVAFNAEFEPANLHIKPRQDSNQDSHPPSHTRPTSSKCSHKISLALAVPNLKSALLGAINRKQKKPTLSFQPILAYNCWARKVSLGLTASALLGPSPNSSVKASDTEGKAIPHPWTMKQMSLSTDFRTCISRLDLAGEIAGIVNFQNYAVEHYALLAAAFPIGERFKAGLRSLYSPKTHSLSSCVEYSDRKRHSATISLEPLCRIGKGIQCKFFSMYKYSWQETSYVTFRFDLRHRDYELPSLRASLRADLSLSYREIWTSALRTDLVFCGGPGFLSYYEQACRPQMRNQTLSVFLRAGVFVADDWNRRIYVYERTAPGVFSLPAFYGRGMWLSSYMNWKFTRWGKLALRLSYTRKNLPKASGNKKPDIVEFLCQASFKF